MRNVLLSAVALAALTGSALAGDLPSRKDVPVYAPPAFTWTGFYAGIEGGAIFPNIRGDGYSSFQTLGALGGVVGYNYQVSPTFVIGLEGDGGAVWGSGHTVVNNSILSAYSATSVNSTYFADIRGRLGYAMDRALLYVAGGVAFGNVETNYLFPVVAAPGLNVTSSRTGWTIGGGLEYAIWDNWIGRVEYRYTDLGSSNIRTPFVIDHVSASSNEVLFGWIYKFGGAAAPVVAKY
jgi:outer membrane immunogenic protein